MHILSLFSLAAIASVASALSGCGKPIPRYFPAPGQSKTLPLPGTDRTYRIHIPANYNVNNRTAVYFSFSGAGRNATEQEGLSQFSNPQFNPNGIAVYPQTQNGVWLSNPKANTSYPNDLDYTNHLLDYLEENLCVDTGRIYANGKSNGGGFTNVIACNATVGSRFAAFSIVSGAFHNAVNVPGVGFCEPAPRKGGYPFLFFHGTVDQTAPINGNVSAGILPVIDILEQWAHFNGCGLDSLWTSNVTTFTQPLVKHVSWACDGRNGIVQFYREGDNGHCWPSTRPNDDYISLGLSKCPMGHYVFNATNYIFDFYSQYRLNV
ncbi:hypothetical protein N7528_004275 [Penicillium herquei]|nr:hypothetical protein N7528_004275 [Penicillium herquei]